MGHTNKCSVHRASICGHNGPHRKKCTNQPFSQRVTSVSSMPPSALLLTKDVNQNNYVYTGNLSVSSTDLSCQNNMANNITSGSCLGLPANTDNLSVASSGLTLQNNMANNVTFEQSVNMSHVGQTNVNFSTVLLHLTMYIF